MPWCAVKSCHNNSSTAHRSRGITLHRFPEELVTKEVWTQLVRECRNDSNWNPTKDSAICSIHFDVKDVYGAEDGYPQLRTDAVPKKFLHQPPSKGEQENLNSSMHFQQSDIKPRAEAGAGSELLACRACLAVDVRLHPISDSGLEDIFTQLTGVPLSVKGFPRLVCAYCRARLSRCAAFRASCQRSTALLQGLLLEKEPLTIDDIKAIDRDSNQLTYGLSHKKVFHFLTHPFLEITPIEMKDRFTPDEAIRSLNNTDVECMEIKVADYWYQDPEVNCTEKSECDVNNETVESQHESPVDSEADDCMGTEVKSTNYYDLRNEGIDIDVNNTEFVEKPKSELLKLAQEISTKTTITDTGNPTIQEKEEQTYERLKRVCDVLRPNFNYMVFEKEFNLEIKVLTKEEQKQEIEERIKKNVLKFKYCCDVCGRGYSLEKTFKNHFACHNPSAGPVECEICRIRFRSKAAPWRNHRSRHQVMFTCQACSYVSRSRSEAKGHWRSHSGATFACRLCDAAYRHKSTYQSHMRARHADCACAECGQVFRSARGVQRHKALSHRQGVEPKPDFKCSICGVVFLNAEALHKHTEAGAGVSHAALWPCAACGESCASDAARAAHAAEKHPPDQLHCGECGVTFSSAASFAAHAQRQHSAGAEARRRRPLVQRGARGCGPPPRAFCEVCGRFLKSEAHLKFHLYTHMERKPYACPMCPKTFAGSTQRKMHMRSHTGERPYQCAHCPLAFALKCNLGRHIQQLHLKSTQRFPCDICHKTFTTPYSVKLHVNTVHNHMPAPKRTRRPKKTADN